MPTRRACRNNRSRIRWAGATSELVALAGGCGALEREELRVNRLPLEARRYFGYFDQPEQQEPVYDPGLAAPCPVCDRALTPTDLRTISLIPFLGNGLVLHARERRIALCDRAWKRGQLSVFYRVHASCHEALSRAEQRDLESRLLALLVPLVESGP